MCGTSLNKLTNKTKQTVAYENNENNEKKESVYSVRIKAGKRRTYFFDIRETRGSDFYLTITESRKRFDSDGYDRHKIFVYKEDFNKFLKGLNEAVDHVKTDLMPDFDFDVFNHDTPYEGDDTNASAPAHTPLATEQIVEEAETAVVAEASNDIPADNGSNEVVDKW